MNYLVVHSISVNIFGNPGHRGKEDVNIILVRIYFVNYTHVHNKREASRILKKY